MSLYSTHKDAMDAAKAFAASIGPAWRPVVAEFGSLFGVRAVLKVGALPVRIHETAAGFSCWVGNSGYPISPSATSAHGKGVTPEGSLDAALSRMRKCRDQYTVAIDSVADAAGVAR